MYRDKYSRNWTGKFPFTTEAVKRAPTSCGVYQILYHDKVVYIGISTTSIRSRLEKHVKGHGNWAAARRSSAEGYEFVYFLCDAESAKQIESHVVTNEKPPYNVKPEYQNFIGSISVH